MITRKDFKITKLSLEQRFALWFHDIIKEVIANDTNTNAKYHIDSKKRLVTIEHRVIPDILVRDYVDYEDNLKEMLKAFGWTMIMSDDDRDPLFYIYDNLPLVLHWSNEQISANDELVRKYKYVTLNSEMWEYGHTDMTKFDAWFDQVAENHQSAPSHYELINQCLAIPYKEIKQASKMFVKSAEQVKADQSVIPIKLQDPYVENLQLSGWDVMDDVIDNENWLICS